MEEQPKQFGSRFDEAFRSASQAANAEVPELRLQAELLAKSTGNARSQSLAQPQLQASREPAETLQAPVASGPLSARSQADRHHPGDRAAAGSPAEQQNSQPAMQEIVGQQRQQPRRFIQVGAAQLRHVRALNSRASSGRSEPAAQVPQAHSLGVVPSPGSCAAKVPQPTEGTPGRRSRAAELRAKLMASLEGD